MDNFFSAETSHLLINILGIMAVLFLLTVGVIIITVIILYVIDKRQTAHTVRRNYPVIGRFRYLFEHEKHVY